MVLMVCCRVHATFN